MMNDKKGQYYERPSYTAVHPILVIGIIIFVIPFLMPVIGMGFSTIVNKIFYGGGVLIILVGGAFSIFNASN